MVLAMAGSCVCAHEAKFYPVQLWTSMRQNDALHKHYSYFFAEVKRLKAIFENLEQNNLFILLDEILKGTNSEDKLHGSLEVSKKILRKNINGIIATHDIEIAELTNTFDNAQSVYFQSKIENNDITFDYILRNGICTSKSATFLLKKEGVL
jgi:DNA mismatch repair ATPase MutS